MAKLKTVLIVRNSQEDLSSTEAMLTEKYKVIVAWGEKEGFDQARTSQPDVILLECSGRKDDEIEICRSLHFYRSIRKSFIVVLKTSGDFETELELLYQGADDLLRKPFDQRELLARVGCLLRRVGETEVPTSLKQGSLELDLETMECTVQNRLIKLSVLEFRLLQYFVENFGRVISREELLDSVWHGAVVFSRIIDTHITSLRRAIRNSGLAFSSIYGAGYILEEKEQAPYRAEVAGNGK